MTNNQNPIDPATEKAFEVLGYTGNDVTLIGFALAIIIILLVIIRILYKDNQEMHKANTDALHKISVALEIIKDYVKK